MKVTLNPEFVFEKSIDGETLIFSPNDGKTFVLNKTATTLLDFCIKLGVDKGIDAYAASLLESLGDSVDASEIIMDARELVDNYFKERVLENDNE